MPARFVLFSLVLPALLGAQQLPTVKLRAGMEITRSVRVAPGVYRLPVRDDSSPALTIRGTGIVVEMAGVTMLGSAPSIAPDERRGLAVLIDGGSGITVRGGTIHGYQTGIRAVGTTDLTLTDLDLSDNWGPRLFSGIGHESLVDWLSFHHNENGEWRRFGAGIALEGVHRGHIQGVKVHHGMNGLMLTRSDSIAIEKNDLSFNSGVGIGLYRSTDNVIVRNQVDYNVRGFSRYYRRGQDSADLLMFEQSSRNVVAFNSMTHGGDGLFLWAGQSTMDTGMGGSNDNLFLGNDFSFAPTNAMEATFSRNSFITNLAEGSEQGLWGGYSYDSKIFANCFGRDRIGIAIEHGQGNLVERNLIFGDSTGIALWADSIAPSDWGYPKHRDTRSHDWQIRANLFTHDRVAVRIRQTDGIALDSNRTYAVDTFAVMRDTAGVTITPGAPLPRGFTGCPGMPAFPSDWRALVHYPTSEAIARTSLSMAPRDRIVVDDWGPYDWTTPRLWPVDSTVDAPLQVLGPSGDWRVTGRRGAERLSRENGRSGDTIVVVPAPGHAGDWELTLADSAGRPFSFEHFDPIPGWEVQYLPAPGGAVDWNAEPILSRHEPRLDKMWYRSPEPAIPDSHWGLLASTEVDLGPGSYTLRAISDDGIRLWVDGQVVIDDWARHESVVDRYRLGPGHHGITVQYRQIDGWMELRVEVVRGWQPSTGSPGPH